MDIFATELSEVSKTQGTTMPEIFMVLQMEI